MGATNRNRVLTRWASGRASRSLRGSLAMVGMIRSVTASRSGNSARIVAVSALAAPVHYHWFVGRRYLGESLDGTLLLPLADGEQMSVEVRATRRRGYRPTQNRPVARDGILSIQWRSGPTDTDHYRFEVKNVTDGSGWVLARKVPHIAGRWWYLESTDTQPDDKDINLRIVPVDVRGNTGAALAVGRKRIVRAPDQPSVTVSFDAGTARITIAEVV